MGFRQAPESLRVGSQALGAASQMAKLLFEHLQLLRGQLWMCLGILLERGGDEESAHAIGIRVD